MKNENIRIENAVKCGLTKPGRYVVICTDMRACRLYIKQIRRVLNTHPEVRNTYIQLTTNCLDVILRKGGEELRYEFIPLGKFKGLWGTFTGYILDSRMASLEHFFQELYSCCKGGKE